MMVYQFVVPDGSSRWKASLTSYRTLSCRARIHLNPEPPRFPLTSQLVVSAQNWLALHLCQQQTLGGTAVQHWCPAMCGSLPKHGQGFVLTKVKLFKKMSTKVTA